MRHAVEKANALIHTLAKGKRWNYSNSNFKSAPTTSKCQMFFPHRQIRPRRIFFFQSCSTVANFGHILNVYFSHCSIFHCLKLHEMRLFMRLSSKIFFCVATNKAQLNTQTLVCFYPEPLFLMCTVVCTVQYSNFNLTRALFDVQKYA